MPPANSPECTHMPSVQSQKSVPEPQEAQTEAGWMKKGGTHGTLLFCPIGQNDWCLDVKKILPNPSQVSYLMWQKHNSAFPLLYFISTFGISSLGRVQVLITMSDDLFFTTNISAPCWELREEQKTHMCISVTRIWDLKLKRCGVWGLGTANTLSQHKAYVFLHYIFAWGSERRTISLDFQTGLVYISPSSLDP